MPLRLLLLWLLLSVLLLLRLLLLRIRLLLMLLLRLRSGRRNAWSTKQVSRAAVFELPNPHGVLQLAQVVEEFFGLLITLLRAAFARTHHDRGKLLRNAIGAPRVEWLRIGHEFGASELRILCIAEDVAPRDRAIKHRSDGIKVRRRRNIARIQDLLGSHVLKRSERHVRTREVCLFQILTRAGLNAAHAEIDNDPAIFSVRLRLHDDVAGLHVAVNDVRSMQIAKRSSDIATKIDRLFDG